MSRERLYLFDTTLRDGAQTNGVDFTLADKLAIAGMLDELGIDSRNKEAEGLFHSEFFLSRPRGDCAHIPIEDLASVSSGICLPYGRRFRLGDDHVVRLSP